MYVTVKSHCIVCEYCALQVAHDEASDVYMIYTIYCVCVYVATSGYVPLPQWRDMYANVLLLLYIIIANRSCRLCVRA